MADATIESEGLIVTERKIRFGILGAGLIAPFHANAIEAGKGCALAGIASRSLGKVEKLAAQFGCKPYASYDAMLADPEIDAVDITIPNHLHHDAAIKAANAGKHILVEKPPAMSLAHVDEMIEACARNNVKLGIVLNCRTRPAVLAIRRAIDEGRFGKIYQVDAYMKWFRAQEYYMNDEWRQHEEWGAGATIQQGFHYVDLMHYLGGPVTAVDCRMDNVGHPGVPVDDTVQAFVDYASGASGVFIGSTAHWPGTPVRIEVNGENGVAVLSGKELLTWKFRDERAEDDEIRSLGKEGGLTGAGGAAAIDWDEHMFIAEGMARAILDGGDPVVTAPSARHTLEITLAMYQSAKKGEPVGLPLADPRVWD